MMIPIYDQIDQDYHHGKLELDALKAKQNQNRAYHSDADESGIETYSQAPSLVQYSTPSNIIKTNVFNTSSISFDLLNPNSGVVKTRYDVKSNTSSSLYGSKSNIQNITSLNPNGSIRSSKRMKVKKYILKKILPDDAYADGEYERAEQTITGGLSQVSTFGSGLNEFGSNGAGSSGKSVDESEKSERENWSGRFDFFLSCLGYAVGLGAVWRFPYLAYKNGGGAFLIPYIIFLFFVGIPLFFLELNLGQYTSQGPIQCWRMAPIFKGLGISMNIISFYFCLYYNMIIAYSLYYLINSFEWPLPWSKCNYAWSSTNCTDDFGESYILRCDQADVYRDINGLCYNYSGVFGRTPIGWWNIKKRLEFRKPVLPSQDYYENFVLQKSPTMENSGTVVWQLAVSLLVAWIIVFFCVFRGIKSSGKVVYFTSLFPYVVLVILGVKGWTLDGAGRGIEYYIKPNMSRLLDINVWFDAAVQIFFTMSTSYGGLIALASYNKFNQNTLRDSLVITISNGLTAIFAGFVVFAYIGYLSKLTELPVQDVVSSGSGLAFIVFPFAVTTLAGAPFWAVLFFIMMLTLGLDSQFASLETIITSLLDSLPKLKKIRVVVIAVICIIMYLLGLPYCTRGGQYWIEMMDKFSSGWAVLIIGILECVCIGWVYGAKQFGKDITLMIGPKFNNRYIFMFWTICWRFVSPILLFALVIVSIVKYSPLKSDTYILPTWMNVIGWLMTASILSGIIFWALFCVIDAVFIHKRDLKTLFEPSINWGPLLSKNKRLAVHLDNLEMFHETKRRKLARMHVNTVQLPSESI